MDYMWRQYFHIANKIITVRKPNAEEYIRALPVLASVNPQIWERLLQRIKNYAEDYDIKEILDYTLNSYIDEKELSSTLGGLLNPFNRKGKIITVGYNRIHKSDRYSSG